MVDEEEQPVPAQPRAISRDDRAPVVDARVHQVVFDDQIQSERSVDPGHASDSHPVAGYLVGSLLAVDKNFSSLLTSKLLVR